MGSPPTASCSLSFSGLSGYTSSRRLPTRTSRLWTSIRAFPLLRRPNARRRARAGRRGRGADHAREPGRSDAQSLPQALAAAPPRPARRALRARRCGVPGKRARRRSLAFFFSLSSDDDARKKGTTASSGPQLDSRGPCHRDKSNPPPAARRGTAPPGARARVRARAAARGARRGRRRRRRRQEG